MQQHVKNADQVITRVRDGPSVGVVERRKFYQLIEAFVHIALLVFLKDAGVTSASHVLRER